jgi:hypothetical protein
MVATENVFEYIKRTLEQPDRTEVTVCCIGGITNFDSDLQEIRIDDNLLISRPSSLEQKLFQPEIGAEIKYLVHSSVIFKKGDTGQNDFSILDPEHLIRKCHQAMMLLKTSGGYIHDTITYSSPENEILLHGASPFRNSSFLPRNLCCK